MTLYLFNSLPYDLQLAAVFETGSYLATRWQEENAVNLYHLIGGPFVEVFYNGTANEITQVRGFHSSAPLADYAVSVQLPGWIERA